MEEQLLENCLKELRFIKNASIAGFTALIALALHAGKPGAPSPADFTAANRLFDQAAKEADLEKP